MGTHTPGPWEVRERGAGNYAIDKAYPHFLGIAYLKVHGDFGRETQEANARLIASAPELLEACRNAAYLLEKQNDDGMGKRTDARSAELYLTLEAVIAKAEGRA